MAQPTRWAGEPWLIAKAGGARKTGRVPQVRTSVPPISCYAASDRTACAAFIKESRMEFDNATNLDRKSGYLGRG